eukprot:SAG25_NODE_1686_length_2554_cov_1.591039_5_plen_45_part_00
MIAAASIISRIHRILILMLMHGPEAREDTAQQGQGAGASSGSYS